MNRRHALRWGIALLLALAVHFAAILYAADWPGAGRPVLRGGGLEDRGGAAVDGGGVLVLLGEPEAPPDATQAEPAMPPPVAPPELPEPPDAAAEIVAPPEPAADATAAVPETPAPEEPGQPVAAAPQPAPKPVQPRPTQQPAESRPAPPTAPPAPEPARKPAETAAANPETATTGGVVFGGDGGRLGTASGNADGTVRELTYGDRVMLWLQRHGEYPFQAARYRLADTVTVEFAINRNGDILYYRLVKDSRWYMLNTAVRQMMDRSSPVPPIPPEISDDELTFTVPVHFTPP